MFCIRTNAYGAITSFAATPNGRNRLTPARQTVMKKKQQRPVGCVDRGSKNTLRETGVASNGRAHALNRIADFPNFDSSPADAYRCPLQPPTSAHSRHRYLIHRRLSGPRKRVWCSIKPLYSSASKTDLMTTR